MRQQCDVTIGVDSPCEVAVDTVISWIVTIGPVAPSNSVVGIVLIYGSL